jgi:hypothetical protein
MPVLLQSFYNDAARKGGVALPFEGGGAAVGGRRCCKKMVPMLQGSPVVLFVGFDVPPAALPAMLLVMQRGR